MHSDFGKKKSLFTWTRKNTLLLLELWGYVHTVLPWHTAMHSGYISLYFSIKYTYRNLSVVKFIPWKLHKQWLPWTSSQMSRNLRYERSASFSFCKSANETSYTRCFKPSDAIFVPCVRFTNVFPTWRWANMFGALISYQSLRENGSTTFFFDPFLPPFERPLFFPTAMLIDRNMKRMNNQTHGLKWHTNEREVGGDTIHHSWQHTAIR